MVDDVSVVWLGVFAWGVFGVGSLLDGVSVWSVSVVVIDDCVYWSFDCVDAFGNGYDDPLLYGPTYRPKFPEIILT